MWTGVSAVGEARAGNARRLRNRNVRSGLGLGEAEEETSVSDMAAGSGGGEVDWMRGEEARLARAVLCLKLPRNPNPHRQHQTRVRAPQRIARQDTSRPSASGA